MLSLRKVGFLVNSIKRLFGLTLQTLILISFPIYLNLGGKNFIPKSDICSKNSFPDTKSLMLILTYLSSSLTSVILPLKISPTLTEL